VRLDWKCDEKLESIRRQRHSFWRVSKRDFTHRQATVDIQLENLLRDRIGTINDSSGAIPNQTSLGVRERELPNDRQRIRGSLGAGIQEKRKTNYNRGKEISHCAYDLLYDAE
jgi:hypothetical protein